MLLPIFDTVNASWPGGFFGVFLSASHYSGFGAQNMNDGQEKLCGHPAFKFAQGCLHYTDRRNGGVSFYTNPLEESMRLRGKLCLGEADMRTHRAAKGGWTEDTAYDTCQSMWREFGRIILAEGRGFWYYGGGRSGGWWDDKDILDTVGQQTRLGEAALNAAEEDENIAETLVVMDNRSWKYFGATPEALSEIDEKTIIGRNTNIVNDLSHLNHNQIMRMGAARNYILYDDFLTMDMSKYKLLIFPSAFYCDENARKRIRTLVENGATAMFFFGAGIVNGVNAGAQNMSDLLGMNIAAAPIGKLEAKTAAGENQLLSGIAPGTIIGDENCQWHRFYIDDPNASVIARYDDARAAMAIKKTGKGNIIYSAVPLMTPSLYRNAARLAGANIYSECDEALYASKRFLVVNTSEKSAGERAFTLPEKAPSVYEIISGRLIAGNAGSFKDTLEDKQTAIYYLGGNPQFIEAIKSNIKK